jgi:SNF2 family DNA or RNA helicase
VSNEFPVAKKKTVSKEDKAEAAKKREKAQRDAAAAGIRLPPVKRARRSASSADVAPLEAGPLFRVQWRRVVLDEAHYIKSPVARVSRACCFLDAQRRWCLSGTPMQNGYDDLYSLVRFLRVPAFADVGFWKLIIRRLGISRTRRGDDDDASIPAPVPLAAAAAGLPAAPAAADGGGVEPRGPPAGLMAGVGSAIAPGVASVADRIIGVAARMGALLERLNTPRVRERKLKKGAKDRDAQLYARKRARDDRLRERALAQMEVLTRAIMLRRKKSEMVAVDLPTRTVTTALVALSADERVFYNALRDRSRLEFSKYLAAGTVMSNYTRIFAMTLRLRQAADHPLLVPFAREAMLEAAAAGDRRDAGALGALARLSEAVARRVFAAVGGLDGGAPSDDCSICLEPLAMDTAVTTPCGHVFCADCAARLLAAGAPTPCPQCRAPLSPAALAPVSALRPKAPSPDPKETKDAKEAKEADGGRSPRRGPRAGFVDGAYVPSSKGRAVVEHVSAAATETAAAPAGSEPVKTVVFSQFTGMLDLLETPLRLAGHAFARYDGSMTDTARDAALARFRADRDCCVLLASLHCCAVGLNLTAASRVLLVDPWWNPFVEEQAIDRVHRIGQTRPVVATRLVAADSVEADILSIQRRKRALSDAALANANPRAAPRLSQDDLRRLFGR